jgi:3-oxoacyl-[acyl-carrier-protein] synthase II
MRPRHVGGRRVAVTGIGVVSSAGIGKDRFWAGITSGRSFVRSITRFDASRGRVQIASEIDDEDLSPFVDGRVLAMPERFSSYAQLAARLAFEDSAITAETIPAERAAIILGTSVGPVTAVGTAYVQGLLPSCDELDNGVPGWTEGFPGRVLWALSVRHGFHGPSATVSTGCAAGADAVGVATESIRWGRSDVALAIGAEAPIEPVSVQAFDKIRTLSRRNDAPAQASRPFDRARDGFVLGEGAAALILEEMEHAVARGARVQGEVLAYATTTDAYHMVAPREDSAKAEIAVRRALALAGLEPEDVDYISAHATSTPLGDVVETRLIKKVFGKRAYAIPVGAIKSIIGHQSGGAGAMQAAANVLTLQHQVLYPTVNLDTPDPECDLDYVAHRARQAKVDCVVQQSFAFSGKNTALVFARSEGAGR